jgi:hypothetical protein
MMVRVSERWRAWAIEMRARVSEIERESEAEAGVEE